MTEEAQNTSDNVHYAHNETTFTVKRWTIANGAPSPARQALADFIISNPNPDKIVVLTASGTSGLYTTTADDTRITKPEKDIISQFAKNAVTVAHAIRSMKADYQEPSDTLDAKL